MKKHIILPVLACLSGLFLAGCSAENPPGATAPPAAPTATLRPPTPTAAPIIIHSTKSSLPPVAQPVEQQPLPDHITQPLRNAEIERQNRELGMHPIENAGDGKRRPVLRRGVISSSLPRAVAPSSVSKATPRVASERGEDSLVWANRKSRVYHYPGSRWYGVSKNSEYMTETAARAAGYTAAENGQ